MNTSEKTSKRLTKALGILQLFIGIGAIGGGSALILDPNGSNLGVPLEMLEHSPFSDFLIPGIVLLLVNGIGSIVGCVSSFRRNQYAAEMAFALGTFLVSWIIIQVYWIQGFHWLHTLYLGIGIIEVILGWLLRKALNASKQTNKQYSVFP